jgi:hypothetical protein
MRLVGTLLMAFVASWLVAGAVAVALGQAFRMDQEFALVLIGLAPFAFGTLVVLAVVQSFARGPGVIGRAARGTALAVVAILGALAAQGYVTSRSASVSVGRDLPIFVTIALCAFATIAVQWWFVRRHWIKKRAAMEAAE